MPFGRGTTEQPYLGDLLTIFINHLLTCHFARIRYLCDLCPNQRCGKTGLPGSHGWIPWGQETKHLFCVHQSAWRGCWWWWCCWWYDDDVDDVVDDDDDDDDHFLFFLDMTFHPTKKWWVFHLLAALKVKVCWLGNQASPGITRKNAITAFFSIPKSCLLLLRIPTKTSWYEENQNIPFFIGVFIDSRCFLKSHRISPVEFLAPLFNPKTRKPLRRSFSSASPLPAIASYPRPVARLAAVSHPRNGGVFGARTAAPKERAER